MISQVASPPPLRPNCIPIAINVQYDHAKWFPSYSQQIVICLEESCVISAPSLRHKLFGLSKSNSLASPSCPFTVYSSFRSLVRTGTELIVT